VLIAIYHITHIRNLTGIVARGCLLCDSQRRAENIDAVSIAYDHLKSRRAETSVRVCQGGTLEDYVPLYFAPRSPMLFAIHKGRVPSMRDGQDKVIYLVTSAEAVRDAGLAFAFTDGHAVMRVSAQYDDLACLSEIDWDIMEKRYWADTNEDPDRSRRRQAEFLVYGELPWDLVSEVAVASSSMREQVGRILTGATHRSNVAVRPSWYY
jgi:hypothetical protein